MKSALARNPSPQIAHKRTDIIDENLRLKHSSVQFSLEIPEGFNPITDIVVMMLPGLGASGEIYKADQHYIAQKTGSAVATLTWGRDFDLHYLADPRREHSRQAVSVAERIDEFLCATTRKIIVGHSNGGGDAAVGASFSIENQRAGSVVGLDLEASIGTEGPQLVKAKEMLGASREVLGATLSRSGVRLAAVTIQFCLANPALILSESIAAVTTDIRPQVNYLANSGVVVDTNVYRDDSVVPTNPFAPGVRIHEGNHFTMLEPEVALANFQHVLDGIPRAD